jgi:hypothetical protein
VYGMPLLCIMASIYSMVAISFERTQAIVINAEKKLIFQGVAVQVG